MARIAKFSYWAATLGVFSVAFATAPQSAPLSKVRLISEDRSGMKSSESAKAQMNYRIRSGGWYK